MHMSLEGIMQAKQRAILKQLWAWWAINDQIHIRPQHGPLCSQKRLIWTHPQITGDGVYKIA
jgi:hypothetical protein